MPIIADFVFYYYLEEWEETNRLTLPSRISPTDRMVLINITRQINLVQISMVLQNMTDLCTAHQIHLMLVHTTISQILLMLVLTTISQIRLIIPIKIQALALAIVPLTRRTKIQATALTTAQQMDLIIRIRVLGTIKILRRGRVPGQDPTAVRM